MSCLLISSRCSHKCKYRPKVKKETLIQNLWQGKLKKGWIQQKPNNDDAGNGTVTLVNFHGSCSFLNDNMIFFCEARGHVSLFQKVRWKKSSHWVTEANETAVTHWMTSALWLSGITSCTKTIEMFISYVKT